MFRTSFPSYMQLDQMDCGPSCLKIIGKFYGSNFDIQYLRDSCQIGKNGSSLGGLIEGANKIKMDAMAIHCSFDDLKEKVPMPCIVHWMDNHFVVVEEVQRNKVKVSDPALGLIEYSLKEFTAGWLDDGILKDGIALLIRPRSDFKIIDMKHEGNYVYSFLRSYFIPFKKLLLQLALGIIIGSVIQLAVPFLTQSIVDFGINQNDTNFILLILFAQLFLYVSQALIELIRSWILLHITTRVNIQIISDFLMKLMGMPISFFDSKNTGDFMQRIYDHKRISRFLSVRTLVAASGVFNLILFGVVLLYFSFKIFIVFALGTILYLVWSVSFLKKRSRIDKRRFNHESKSQTSILQFIQGIEEIKFNGSQGRKRLEWYSIQTKLFDVSIDSLRLQQTQLRGGDIINELKNILIIFITATAVVEGNISLGTMLAILYIIGNLTIPVRDLVRFIFDYQDAKLSIARLVEIHSLENKTIQKDTFLLKDLKKVIFKDVSFSYKGTGNLTILKNLNFSIPIGKTTAIVGESGAGKTTMLKLLLKVYEPIQGIILLDKKPLKNIDKESWRQNCGVVLQNGFIFNDSIKNNITESKSTLPFDKKSYARALEIANLKTFIAGLPNEDATKIGATGVSLSGGEKQRILIARAVYKDPDFIFFDEATSSLDSRNEKEIMQGLENFFKNKTVVTIAHRMSTVKKADQIIVLNDGKISEQGTHHTLLNKKGAYYHLVKGQL